MKYTTLLFIAVCSISLSACHWGWSTITGNGNTVTEKRSVQGFSKVAVGGPFEVTITQGDLYEVTISADENLMQYINFDKDGRELEVKVKNGVNIKSKNGIKVTIVMPEVDALSFSGSGNIKVNGQLQNSHKIDFSVAGSGNIEAAVKCPEVGAEIAGSGTIALAGETRDVKIEIAGSGDYKGESLLSETSNISIAGSGSAYVFASSNLDISIAGSGDVYYKGNPPNIKRSVAGSGNIKPLQ